MLPGIDKAMQRSGYLFCLFACLGFLGVFLFCFGFSFGFLFGWGGWVFWGVFLVVCLGLVWFISF